MEALTRRLFSGGAWALGARAATAFSVLVANALLARLLSPSDLGTYFLAFSVASFGSLVGTLGLNQVVVRFVAENMGLGRSGQNRRVVGIVFVLGSLGAAGVGIMYLLFGHLLANHLFHAPALAAVSGLVAGWMVVLILQTLQAETFRGFADIRLASIFNGLVAWIVLIPCLGLMWILTGQVTFANVVLLTVGSSFVSVLLAGLLLRRKLGSLPKKGEEKSPLRTRKLLEVSFPLLVATLAIYAAQSSDVWIVGALLTKEEVAIYGAAARLITMVVVPFWIVNNVIPPLVVEMNAQGRREELERVARGSGTFAGVLAIFALTVLVLFGGPVLGLVYGDYYRAGWYVLILLSAGYFVQVCTGPCGITLILTGHQKVYMGITVVGGLLTIIPAPVIVSHFGIGGMATIVSISIIIQHVSFWLIAKRRVGIWTHVSLYELFAVARYVRARYL